LFAAAVKLLRFAIGIDTVRVRNDAEDALRRAIMPLLSIADEHVLATISAVVLALCGSRQNPIGSGVAGGSSGL
ncbi:MAG: hypothetical protein OIF54_11030, partial [Cohaesibacter sp.]|nr:hypothetical protein [Cohaesibacter sp.]